ncbi:MAG TPA: metallophosphoesterase family protein [Anaerolineae bacterium]|nr:metallophosphoesterase family protein [Anaerolineae bacterium]
MKIAILSDIHGNIPALRTVLDHIDHWQPDQVIVNGDIINRGPYSQQAWHIIDQHCQQQGWLRNHGNHEEYVTPFADPSYQISPLELEIHYLAYWTYQQFTPDEITAIKQLPFSHHLPTGDGREIRIAHGSHLGVRQSIWPHTTDDAIKERLGPPPAILCVAHSHKPLIKPFGHTLIANSGSVGSPCDGDTRASYLQLERGQDNQWTASIIRLGYDRQLTDQHFHQSGFLEESGPISHLIYHEWRLATVLVGTWFRQYQTAVLNHQIPLATAVNQHLAAHGIDSTLSE